ncbi:unnamed protein product [Paramecium sonneborni]|uniref:Uncharacterized protein n=1 Tax=Paramecium sonneborni TaxID=65129 RepID=A0A8S1QQX1_9CILI|nr:unnamed protein product [Paramecium sonneborni]
MFSSQSMQEHILYRFLIKLFYLYDEIYQYLSIKSETANPPAILIPDTVIFIPQCPSTRITLIKKPGKQKRK